MERMKEGRRGREGEGYGRGKTREVGGRSREEGKEGQKEEARK